MQCKFTNRFLQSYYISFNLKESNLGDYVTRQSLKYYFNQGFCTKSKVQPICSTGDWWQNFAPINPLRKVKTVVRNSIVRRKLSATMTIVIKVLFLINIFLHKVNNIYILNRVIMML